MERGEPPLFPTVLPTPEVPLGRDLARLRLLTILAQEERWDEYGLAAIEEGVEKPERLFTPLVRDPPLVRRQPPHGDVVVDADDYKDRPPPRPRPRAVFGYGPGAAGFMEDDSFDGEAGSDTERGVGGGAAAVPVEDERARWMRRAVEVAHAAASEAADAERRRRGPGQKRRRLMQRRARGPRQADGEKHAGAKWRRLGGGSRLADVRVEYGDVHDERWAETVRKAREALGRLTERGATFGELAKQLGIEGVDGEELRLFRFGDDTNAGLFAHALVRADPKKRRRARVRSDSDDEELATDGRWCRCYA